MRSWKSATQRLYRRLPQSVRDMLRTFGPVAAIRRRYFESDTALHDVYYDSKYYETIAAFASRDAPIIGKALLERFRPASAIDVGCGTGDYLAVLREAGVEVHGVELAEAALQICHDRGLDVRRVDLTTAEALPWTADLVCSFEVAEHLAEPFAGNFVRLLTAAARRHVCLTAALPGQESSGHVNLQPKSYWIDLFERAGFAFDEAMTRDWEAENATLPVAGWFQTNLMIFHAPR